MFEVWRAGHEAENAFGQAAKHAKEARRLKAAGDSAGAARERAVAYKWAARGYRHRARLTGVGGAGPWPG